ncbi:MAG TPA: DUF4199 domain-containing protein [Ignavibacteriaceae bacterium]|nr:DUF4199 domain-containing protein [Ignavibacteriaceae bacterium]
MVSSKIYISPLVCGFGVGVLSIIPELKTFACCLLVPAAAFFSLYLNQKINRSEERITSRQAITFGLLTGLFAALFSTSFDILLTFIIRTNDFVQTLPETEKLMKNYNLGPIVEETLKALKMMASDITNKGFSFLYLIATLFSNLLINTIFGLIGGLMGMNFLNRKISGQN